MSPNTANAKMQRIIQYSTEIQSIKILEKKERTVEYQKFIENVLSYNQNGKNKHEDAPDSLALMFLTESKKVKPAKILPISYKIC